MVARLTARFPTLTAALIYVLAVILAFNRFFAGQVLLAEASDQRGGYPPRLVAAEYFREFGSIPEWSPWLFGGFPFVSNTGFGDTFFPTALLRILLPVDQGMALGLMIFIVLAGVFAFSFLRALGLSWGASFVGGGAYMFSGMVVSLVSPGHDGKLYVTAMLPLALMFLYRGVAAGDWREYLYFGVTVGFSLLTPHFQATYYLLMAAGFFWAFMVFLSGQRHERESWWRASLLFGASLAVGFAMAAVQLLPFIEYVPFSPRGHDSSSSGWAYATSWSMGPEELFGAFLPGFNGVGIENYFGRNFFKLHSEYMGLIAGVLALAAFKLSSHRRLAWFFVFLAAYGALFAFGGYTPFYQLPYNLLPQISKTRAPSIIFFLVSLSVAVLAAFGTEYLLSRGGEVGAKVKENVKGAVSGVLGMDRGVLIGMGVLAFMALLALVGGLRPIMDSMAQLPGANPSPNAMARRLFSAEENYPHFVRHFIMALILAVAAVWALLPGSLARLGREGAALIVGLLVLADLWIVERSYIRFSPRADVIMPADDVVRALHSDSSLYRVLPLDNPFLEYPNPYGENYFMVHGIRSALGYNGFELHLYDELLGGKNTWSPQPWDSNVMDPSLWRLLGVRYVVIPEPIPAPFREAESLKEFWGALEQVATGLRSYTGIPVALFRVVPDPPFAYLTSAAWRVEASPDRVIGALLSPEYDPRGLLILDKDAPFGADSLPGAGTPVGIAVRARESRPGKLHFELERPAEGDVFLYVAENYYPGWRATVDGESVPVARAQLSLMALPVRAGARSVDLEFSLGAYHTGRVISLMTFVGVLLIALLAWLPRLRARAILRKP